MTSKTDINSKDGDGSPDESDPSSTNNDEQDKNNLKRSVMLGSLKDLPEEQRKVIRIFISSTFTGKQDVVYIVQFD